MNQFTPSEIVIKFDSDTLATVSSETAYELVKLMGMKSLEDLIHLLLRNLAAETSVIPTSKLIAYPQQSRYILDIKLHEMIADVTAKNTHEQICFGKTVGKDRL